MGFIVTIWFPDHDNELKNRFTDQTKITDADKNEKLRVKIKEIMQAQIDKNAQVYTIKTEV